MPRRAEILDRICARVMDLDADTARLVAVDGTDGVGKTVFADALAERLRVNGAVAHRVSLDGFHRPRADRYRAGRHSPEGYFRDSYDLRAFRAAVTIPLRSGSPALIRNAVFDHVADRPADGEQVMVEPDDVVVVDGVFLHRDELRHLWHLTVYLRAPWRVALERMAGRDGFAPDPESSLQRRYLDGQRLYHALCEPERRADVVVDNERYGAPVIAAWR